MTRMIITLLKVIVLCTVFSINCLGLSDLHYYEYGERKEFPIGTEFAFGSTSFDLISFQSLQKQVTTPNTLSNLKQIFWIKVPVSAYDIHEKAVFTFSNSQINEIKVWWVDEKDSIIQEMPLSGDHLPFMNRDAKVGFFAYYVPANSKVKYFIAAIDKREEIFFCNFHKYSNFQFTRRVQSESLVYGGILGVVGIIFFSDHHSLILCERTTLFYLWWIFTFDAISHYGRFCPFQQTVRLGKTIEYRHLASDKRCTRGHFLFLFHSANLSNL